MVQNTIYSPWSEESKSVSHSVVSDSLQPLQRTMAYQAPLSMEFSRQKYWRKILELVAIPISRGSSWPWDQTQVSCIIGRFFTVWATREASRALEEELKVPDFAYYYCFVPTDSFCLCFSIFSFLWLNLYIAKVFFTNKTQVEDTGHKDHRILLHFHPTSHKPPPPAPRPRHPPPPPHPIFKTFFWKPLGSSGFWSTSCLGLLSWPPTIKKLDFPSQHSGVSSWLYWLWASRTKFDLMITRLWRPEWGWLQFRYNQRERLSTPGLCTDYPLRQTASLPMKKAYLLVLDLWPAFWSGKAGQPSGLALGVFEMEASKQNLCVALQGLQH